MYKQSAYVLALFLGTSSATQVSQGFATGMNGDEDLGEDITMKGDKFHFAQNVQLSAEPAAATTVKADYPPPEKVHTLDPKIAKAHTTFYNAKSLVGVDQDVRTAFYAQYDKQNGLWRVDDSLIGTEAADVPQIHPYNYNPWVYKFSRDAMGPHSQHIDDDPEDSRPKSKEELANSPEAVAKKEKADAEEKKLKDNQKMMKDDAEASEKQTPAEAKKADAEALEAALKKADIAEELAKVEKKEEKKAELLMTNYNDKFYNAQDGLWMYNLVQAEPVEEKKAAEEKVEDFYGQPDKVQNLMPQRYELRANTNMVNGVNVRRTTFYGQKEPNFIQLEGEPERSGQTVAYDEYGPTEKVQNLMPRRYERSANSNYVDGVHVKRTTWYAQLDDDMNTQLSEPGTPTDGVQILEPIAYKHAADTNLPFTRTTFY